MFHNVISDIDNAHIFMINQLCPLFMSDIVAPIDMEPRALLCYYVLGQPTPDLYALNHVAEDDDSLGKVAY